MNSFTQRAIKIIQDIPEGRVMTYGRVAARAGNSSGARQISRLLHSTSKKYDLPWHRIINASGKISLKKSHGYELQKALLESEGIQFSLSGSINLKKYLWQEPCRTDTDGEF